jgi:hypothetical protein
VTAEPILLEARYRNDLEKRVALQLKRAGVKFEYEPSTITYSVPARQARYLPDFVVADTPIIIETKGWFGRSGAKERQKLVLLKEQHPDIDFRIVFSDANKKIYKGSKTTYAKWATDHGIPWADKGVVPAAWIKEILTAQEK